jgi:hypothetical protein
MVMVGDGSDPGARADPEPVATPETVLKRYAGTYYSAEVDAVFTVSFTAGRLELMRETDAAPAALEPFGRAFRVRGLTLTFQPGAAGSTDRFTVDAGRVRGILFERRQ